ncbi:TPA-induced transmembrane protein [Seriola lalandi dorsalis]|uniref:SEA domain-containing protein n=1 Tax=Seriola lalandi dorsalis TaxID=1841481 RepID=A0A3B4YLT9_SERLL|nr:TPA-induced transmembrane protein [Seriola lalandi dorsalis]
MDPVLPLYTINGNDGGSYSTNEWVTTGNGDGVAYKNSEETERDNLLTVQVPASNGEMTLCDHEVEAQRNPANAHTPQEISSTSRVKRELSEIVFWRVRLWMVIISIFVLIVVVIIISLVVCSAIHEDPDEKFDPSLFKVPLFFNGSFQLSNKAFEEEHSTLNYSSDALTADLQEKLADIYRSSPALGRYFSKAEIHVLRNSSVIADYHLTFLMPEEQQDQLRNFTLSREMVYNVFRQFLYDQEPDSSELLYIDPLSLNMS